MSQWEIFWENFDKKWCKRRGSARNFFCKKQILGGGVVKIMVPYDNIWQGGGGEVKSIFYMTVIWALSLMEMYDDA